MVNMHLSSSLAVVCCAGLLTTVVNAGSEVEWWKRSVIYQVYPRSFQDSDGDGIGDIKGIISRLHYFQYLNVNALWLNPIYPSPMVDFGYDVKNFTDIDAVFGSLADFNELVHQAHQHGIYIIMDFIPNHSSDQHQWFIESRKGGKDNPFSDFYVWHDGKMLENGTRVPPNNWPGCFGGSAWTSDVSRGQYYLHQFTPEQPDLNYRNKRVRQEMEKVLSFWLDRGVDGFRVDAIATLFETDNLLLDEPFLEETDVTKRKRIYTRSLPEIHDVVREWRQLFDLQDAVTGRHTFMVTESHESVEMKMKYYLSGADMPFNFQLIDAQPDCKATCLKELVEHWMSAMPDGKWPNFVTGSHDCHRVSARRGSLYVNAMNVLLLTLPGTPTTYYGEELGMDNIEVSYEDTQDPRGKNLGPEHYNLKNRDPCRSPMLWDDSGNAGFSSANKTWLPVHPDYRERNVKIQQSTPYSPLNIYRSLSSMRKDRTAFHTTHITFLPGSDDVITYIRYNPDDSASSPYLVAISFAPSDSEAVGIRANTVKVLDKGYSQGTVELDTMTSDSSSELLSLMKISLKPGQAIVLQLAADQSKQEL